VDCSTEPITVLREGAITKAELEEALVGVESFS
jgi:tRNA A37 threonylcarbamoyladenosine synthetase subunit TsaC/SUA5/YrdC